MKVYIDNFRAAIWANAGLSQVSVVRPIRFAMGKNSLYVRPGFRTDCASVPIWWVSAGALLALVALASGEIPHSLPAAGAVASLTAVVLLLRKAALIPVGIIHDAMYAGQVYLWADRKVNKRTGLNYTGFPFHVTRAEADRFLRKALVLYCMPKAPKLLRYPAAWLAWLAVRLFGGMRYNSTL